MTPRLSATASRWVKFAAIPLVALVIGLAVALASSPSSLGRSHALGTPVPPSPTPAPSVTPLAPSVTEAGILGLSPRLVARDPQSIAGMTSNRAAATADRGQTWTKVGLPAGGSGIAIDPGNPQRAIAGGVKIQFTTDGGLTWKPSVVAPPSGGPYQVLGVSPFDGKVWFFTHQGKLLRTGDESATWRDIPGLPALSNPIIAQGPVFGEFFLASDNRVFDLIVHGQQITEQPALPSGVTVVALASTGGRPASWVARDSKGVLYTLQGAQWGAVSEAPKGPLAAGGTGAILVGDGSAKLGVQGSVRYSFDAGTKWYQATGLPYDQSVEAIAGQPNSTTFFAYCYGGDVYTSSDSGRTWMLLSRALRTALR